MKFFLLDFLNRMSCKNRNGVMLVTIIFQIFSQFFKIRVEWPFKFEIDRILIAKMKVFGKILIRCAINDNQLLLAHAAAFKKKTT